MSDTVKLIVTDREGTEHEIEAFFTTDFEGGRHQRRVKKLGKLCD